MGLGPSPSWPSYNFQHSSLFHVSTMNYIFAMSYSLGQRAIDFYCVMHGGTRDGFVDSHLYNHFYTSYLFK